jgi:hypothetical protein
MVANSTATVAVLTRSSPSRVNRKAMTAGREHFEEAFHPQVHHPPAPVLHHGDMRVLAPHEPRAVEQADADRGCEQQQSDGLGFTASLDGRPESATHQRQPDAEAGKQEDLPEAAEVDVFPALVTEPEILREPELLHHRQPLARECPHHDDEQAGEQYVDAQALELRFMAGYCRANVQTHAKPGGRDPQHRELRVPGTAQRIWQVVGEREAVGLLALDLVVSRDRS